MSDDTGEPGHSASNPSGPGGAGWRPSVGSDPLPTSQSSTPRRPAVTSSNSIVGDVRGFQTRTESRGPQYRTEIIWTFRVERFDTDGNRLPPVPVEMRSKSFKGFVNEGDRVSVPGKWREGQILHPRKLRNISTGALVKAGGIDSIAIVKVILFLAVVTTISYFVYTRFWRPPRPVKINGPVIKIQKPN